ncbi:MAG: GrpB family protein [Lachnospiraceae bacterium]|nr:GrpB family protein [Lachnospiraceae bacterium]
MDYLREIIPVTDIQHIGNTTVKNIQAKSVIDIIVGVKDFENIDKFSPALEDTRIFLTQYFFRQNISRHRKYNSFYYQIHCHCRQKPV